MLTNRGAGVGAPPRTAFDPVIKSAVGIVRERAGLVSNIAELGLALFVDTGAAPRAANIIPFPGGRRSKRQQRTVAGA